MEKDKEFFGDIILKVFSYFYLKIINIISGTQGVIFIIDASDEEKFEIAKKVKIIKFIQKTFRNF